MPLTIQPDTMNSKNFSIFIALLIAACLAPASSCAQLPSFAQQTSSDVLLLPHSSPVPSPSDFGDDTLPLKPAWNNIYAEALGSGLVYTLNYERLLSSSFGLRLGFGYLPVSNSSGTKHASITSAPLTLSWFPFGASSSKLEIGAGLSYIDLTKSVRGFPQGSTIGYSGIIGYRYEEEDGGFLFRAGYTPIILAGSFYSWGGVSLGFGF